MLRFHLNLATNPFVNYRKYYLVGILLLLVGVGGAVYSGRQYLRLRRNNRDTTHDLQAKRQELNELGRREDQLKDALRQPHVLDEVDQINFYNTLIQRKTFPWTQFFEDLEAVLPYNVQITEIRQKASLNSVSLEMIFMGRTSGDAVNFLRNLENSPKFRNVIVNQAGSFRQAATHQVSSDVEVVLHMEYQP